MSDRSAIEWTDASWNPIRARDLKTGRIGWHCEHVTTGCEFCYAEGFNKRLGTGLPFKPGYSADINIFLDAEMLMLPLRWKRPRKIFVCSMSDLFAHFVADEWIDKMFAVMALCPQHTFQVLTKRAGRMRDYMRADRRSRWFAPNVWLGVSCERQQEADLRIPLLLQTPAAVRFVSAEPLLGPIDQRRALYIGEEGGWEYVGAKRQLLHWVIVGGESGSKARPMHPQWARDLRDQCQAAGVAFFFKQWGEWAFDERVALKQMRGDDQPHAIDECWSMIRVGKKAAGRLLDGREWNEFPQRTREGELVVIDRRANP